MGDVVRANLPALQSDYQGAVNIGTGVETDVLTLHDRLAEAAGHPVPVAHAPERPGEQRRSVISPALAAEVLGWRPEVEVGEGLARTFRYFAEKAGR